MKNCIQCNKEFLKKPGKKFCSQYCNTKHWRIKNRKHYLEIRRRHRRGMGKPEFGSKEHRRKISETLKKRGIKPIQRFVFGKGDKHPNWKGGVTSKEKMERRKFQETIQKLVFKRDGYTCCLCDEKGGILHVDHIQKWSEYVKRRFDINNCRTICRECHYFITFGKQMPQGSLWALSFKKGGYQNFN